MLHNDFLSLPIIITDYDALTADKSHPYDSSPRDNQSSSAASTASSQQRWSTGFSNFTDALWDRMASGMKDKLRAACIEVLNRTEGTGKETVCWQYDEDARMLD